MVKNPDKIRIMCLLLHFFKAQYGFQGLDIDYKVEWVKIINVRPVGWIERNAKPSDALENAMFPAFNMTLL